VNSVFFFGDIHAQFQVFYFNTLEFGALTQFRLSKTGNDLFFIYIYLIKLRLFTKCKKLQTKNCPLPFKRRSKKKFESFLLKSCVSQSFVPAKIQSIIRDSNIQIFFFQLFPRLSDINTFQ